MELWYTYIMVARRWPWGWGVAGPDRWPVALWPILLLALYMMSLRWRAIRATTEDLTRWLRRRLYLTAEQVKRNGQ